MKLTPEQISAVLEKTGSYITTACDRCGNLLGSVRWTIKDQPSERCSRECRDGIAAAERHARLVQAKQARRGGRPTKYATVTARREAKREQNAAWARDSRAEHPGVGKNHPVSGVESEAPRRENAEVEVGG